MENGPRRALRAVSGWLVAWSFELLVALVAALVVQAAAGGTLMRGPVPLAAVAAVSLALGCSYRSRPPVLGLVSGSFGLTLANQLDTSTGFSALNDLAFFSLLVVGAPLALGYVLGERAAQIGELRRRTRALDEQQQLIEALARSDERSRIAMRVHAAVAQRVGEIALQAAGIECLATADAERATLALARIEESARASLDDVREIIGVLRASPGGGLA